MQVRKFEAATMQEALDIIKKELGPEAIILQTKKNRRGFGLLSKSSVEVTAAVSERSIQKKQGVEKRLPEEKKNAVRDLPAEKQANIYNKYADSQLQQAKATQERVEFSQRGKRITATRYIDIDGEEKQGKELSKSLPRPEIKPEARPEARLDTKPYTKPDSRPDSRPATKQAASYESHLQGSSQLDQAFNNEMRVPATSSLEQQINSLKQMVEEMRTANDSKQNHSDRLSVFKRDKLGSQDSSSHDSTGFEEAYEQLVMSGVERRYALALIKRIKLEQEVRDHANEGDENNSQDWSDSSYVSDCLAEQLMNTLDVVSVLGGIQQQSLQNKGTPMSLALIGSTGVGKTTTLAKIASEAMGIRNLKIGLVNLDHQKIGAFEQLATYAKILGVPFRSANTADDLKAILSDFQALDLILVDVAGYSQRDSDSIKQLQELLRGIPNLNSYLVLSATTREPELYDTINRFANLGPKGLILSKLDEAVVYGAIYNVTQRSKLPLAYFTTGQTVPGDIEEATRERVASLIIDI